MQSNRRGLVAAVAKKIEVLGCKIRGYEHVKIRTRRLGILDHQLHHLFRIVFKQFLCSTEQLIFLFAVSE